MRLFKPEEEASGWSVLFERIGYRLHSTQFNSDVAQIQLKQDNCSNAYNSKQACMPTCKTQEHSSYDFRWTLTFAHRTFHSASTKKAIIITNDIACSAEACLAMIRTIDFCTFSHIHTHTSPTGHDKSNFLLDRREVDRIDSNFIVLKALNLT